MPHLGFPGGLIDQRTKQGVPGTSHALRSKRLLHERCFGDWRGQPSDSLGIDPLAMDAALPCGESSALSLQRQAELGRPLVVVPHGLIIHQILAASPPSVHSERELDLPSMSNTAMAVSVGRAHAATEVQSLARRGLINLDFVRRVSGCQLEEQAFQHHRWAVRRVANDKALTLCNGCSQQGADHKIVCDPDVKIACWNRGQSLAQ